MFVTVSQNKQTKLLAPRDYLWAQIFLKRTHTKFIVFFCSQVEIEGLTGFIRFNGDGRRQNYTLNVVEMSLDHGFVKVAEWSDETEFTPLAAKYMTTYPLDNVEMNRTFIVTTIIEEPFVMTRKSKFDEQSSGRTEYEGFCKDLADLLGEQLGINRKCDFNVNFSYCLTDFLWFFLHSWAANCEGWQIWCRKCQS